MNETLFLARNKRDSTNVEVYTKNQAGNDILWAVLFEDFMSDGAHETVQYALQRPSDEEVECVLVTKEAWDAILGGGEE